MTERRLRIAAKLFGLAVLKRIRTGNERTHFATFELTGERTAEAYAVAREAGELVTGQDRLTTIDGPGPDAGKPLWLSESVWCEVETFKPVRKYGWGWRVQGAPDCPAFGSQAAAARYCELRQAGLEHLPAWDLVEAGIVPEWELCGEGPWPTQAAAQEFLDAEVGASGAEVIKAGDVWFIGWPKEPAPTEAPPKPAEYPPARWQVPPESEGK